MIRSSARPAGETAVGSPQMPATPWSRVLTARDLNDPGAQAALAKLCEIYWYPLYAFVRRQGHAHHQAQDLTQGFFQHLFEQTHWLAGVGREKGRFRSFLLCSLSNYLLNEQTREHAQKRGGGPDRFVSWDPELGAAQMQQEPATEPNPGAEFDRLWASALVGKAFACLQHEYERCGKSALFLALSPYLTRPMPAGYYTQVARNLGTSEGALRIAMHRLVQSFGQRLREQVAQTVSEAQSVDDELRDVLKAWAANPE